MVFVSPDISFFISYITFLYGLQIVKLRNEYKKIAGEEKKALNSSDIFNF